VNSSEAGFKAGWLAIVVLLLAGAILVAWYFHLRRSGEPGQPYALWRDGEIVVIRHCKHPSDRTTLQRCVSLICEQAISRKLVNPMEARLKTGQAVIGSANGLIEVSGTISYRTSISQPLPTGYKCELQRTHLVDSRLIRAKH